MPSPEARPGAEVGAIIVAAGLGTRLGGADKAFLPLKGELLLAYSASVFQRSTLVDAIVLVLQEAAVARGRALAQERGWWKVKAVCPGGERRQDSVRAGLLALGPARWVIVHDGARPLVREALIAAGLKAAKETGAAAAALPVTDTIKVVGARGLVRRTPSRQGLWAAQTPQVFRYSLLKQAFERAADGASPDVTDEAMLIERLGHRVRVFPGVPDNIKLTTPEDLALAEFLLSRRDW